MLFKLAVVLVLGCLAGKLAKALKLANVFGYLLAGLLLGPLFRLVTESDLASFTIVAEIALAVVAFRIGSEFVLNDLKIVGTALVVITLAEAAGAVLLVFAVFRFLLQQDLGFSLILAGLAAVTAPAAALMVIRQYRADGPVTRTLLPVAALDGVLGVLLFGLALSWARIYLPVPEGAARFWSVAGGVLLEVGGSLLLGAGLGLVLAFLIRKAGDSDELLIITLALILVSTTCAKLLGLSALLANIVLGAVLVNLTPNSNRVFFSLNHFTPPLYLLFFTLIGASVQLQGVVSLVLLGAAYLVVRAGGKILGSWLGAKAVSAEPGVQKYLGLALLPQGEISIALAVLVRQQLPQYSAAVTTIIVFTVLLFEVVGPLFARTAVEKSGEVGGMGRQLIG